MQILQIGLLPEFIKMRWNEPFATAALNRKTFKTTPRGVYSGFVVKAGPGDFQVSVKHDDPEGYGEATGYSGGAYDAGAGWSVAVHESVQGYNTTVAILSSAQANFVADLSAAKGMTVFLALNVTYQSGLDTSGSIVVVEAADLELDPTLIVLARVDVPMVAAISNANVIYDDAAYPRVLPFASEFKSGFMEKAHVTSLRELRDAILTSEPAYNFDIDIEGDGVTEVLLPPGLQYTIGGNDLWVFRNGSLMAVSRDYSEVNRGDGFGEQIEFIEPLYDGDVIRLRVQAYAVSAISTTSILDESALIASNVTALNFSGSGVTVLPDGPNRAKVVIAGGGGGGASAVRTKQNSTLASIPAYRAVSLAADNSIKPFDPTNDDENFYGLTLQTVPSGSYGDVQLLGIVEGAASGIVSAIIGQDVYVSHAGDGSLTASAPDPVLGQVYKVGVFEGANLAVTTTASDILIDKVRLA